MEYDSSHRQCLLQSLAQRHQFSRRYPTAAVLRQPHGCGGELRRHRLDDQGRQFNGQGNLLNWWTPEDAAEFEKRAECFIKEYSAFTPVDDVHLNGKLTLGENTADNGGVRLAFRALMQSLNGKPQPKVDGFTPQQRFFLAWGQAWCENVRPEMARMLAQTDPHS